MNDRHTPQTAVETQAKQFQACFEPSAYKLEDEFGWMPRSMREELGRLAGKKLREAYVEVFTEMYGGGNDD